MDWNYFQSGQQYFRIASAMRFHVPNDHIDAFRAFTLGRFEHGVRFANAGGVTEENSQFSSARSRFLRVYALE